MFDSLERLDRDWLLKINAMHTPFMDGMMFFITNATWVIVLVILVTAFCFLPQI